MINILNDPGRCRGYFLDRVIDISNVKHICLTGRKLNTLYMFDIQFFDLIMTNTKNHLFIDQLVQCSLLGEKSIILVLS